MRQTSFLSILCRSVFLPALTVVGCQRHDPPMEMPPQMDLSRLLQNDDLQSLGRSIFFDANLSTPPGQSCAACHGPEVGWTGPDEELNKAGSVYPGAVHTRFGSRKPNSSAYATRTPAFHAVQNGDDVEFVGGNFWDGRATGWKLGNPAADQAQGPFLNPVEQNNAGADVVVRTLCRASYAGEFNEVVKKIWGIEDVCSANPELVYGIVAIAIAAFEHSPLVNEFSSKYDLYLRGKASLTAEEHKGLELFEGKAQCSKCHTSRPGPGGEPPLFTDFTYDNIGIPRNPDNPWYRMSDEFNPEGREWVDPGLGGFLKEIPQYAMFARENLGKHRVPTLRNVDRRPRASFVKAFGHNGYFKSLDAVVHFYNTRDVPPTSEQAAGSSPGVSSWPPPEVAENLNKDELGDLKLTADEEAAIVAFMKTLSDGFKPD